MLFRALTRARRAKEAAAAFDEMVALGLVPRVTHYQQLIVLFALTDDLAGAEAWAARLLKDKDGVLPSRDALDALVLAYRRAPAADAKKHEAKLAACVKRLDELVATETAGAIAGEPRGVQWKMKFKAVTSTGGDDKAKADAKPAAAAAPKKK